MASLGKIDKKDIRRAVTVIAACDADSAEGAAEDLIQAGFEEAVAWRLLAFVPSGLARPLLDCLGVFVPETVPVMPADDEPFEIHLDDQPEYLAAVAFARELHDLGAVDDPDFLAVLETSAEIEALRNTSDETKRSADLQMSTFIKDPNHARFVIRRGQT